MRLRVLTYNIHRAIGMDRRFRLERIARIVEHHAPDIALLQEVDDGAPRSREMDLAKELAAMLGYPHFAAGYNHILAKGRYGNATLSRYPILRERNIDLTVDTRKRRGCQHTTIEVQRVAGHPHVVDVFNLHLGLSARERARQVGALVRSEEFAPLREKDACIVAGDFNDWRYLLHPVFTEVLAFGCACCRPENEEETLRTFPSFSPRGGLDRIYHRGPLQPIAARTCGLPVSRVASDHLPVVADYELR